MVHIDMMAWMMVVMACSTTFRNLGDGSNHQNAARLQERIQPHWDRTLFSLITTSRHLKMILKRIKPIISKSFQIYNCKLTKLHKFGKKTTWIFIEVIMVMRIQRHCLCFTLRSSFLVDFKFQLVFQSQIVKSSNLSNRMAEIQITYVF